MTARAVLFGVIGLIALFAFMLWNGAFMHGDPVEQPQEVELAE